MVNESMKQILLASALMVALVSCGEEVDATTQPPPAVPNTPVVPVVANLSAKPSKWTDPDTGCQYLIFFGGYNGDTPAATPRNYWNTYAQEEQQMCGQQMPHALR